MKGEKKYFHLPNMPRKEVQIQSGILNPNSSIRTTLKESRQQARLETLQCQIEESNEKRKRRIERIQKEQERLEREAAERSRIELARTRKIDMAVTIKEQKQIIDGLQQMISQMEVDHNKQEENLNVEHKKQEENLHRELTEEKEKRLKVERSLKSLQVMMNRERKRKQEESPLPSSRKVQKYEDTDILCMVQDFFSNCDGPSRLSLTDPKWYALRPTAAPTLFGFQSYDELQEYVRAFFQIELLTPKLALCSGKVRMEPRSPTDFEQIILVKHFLHACPNRGKLGLMYNVHRTTISNYLRKWAPQWAKYGEHL